MDRPRESRRELMARFRLSRSVVVATRPDVMSDHNQILATTGAPNGLVVGRLTADLNVNLAAYLLWRVEVRSYLARDQVFPGSGQNRTDDISCREPVRLSGHDRQMA